MLQISSNDLVLLSSSRKHLHTAQGGKWSRNPRVRLFVLHFTPYLTGLSSMMLIWAAGDRCKWRAHFHNRMLWQRLEPQISESLDKHSTTEPSCHVVYNIIKLKRVKGKEIIVWINISNNVKKYLNVNIQATKLKINSSQISCNKKTTTF